jgi:hypothetical protein
MDCQCLRLRLGPRPREVMADRLSHPEAASLKSLGIFERCSLGASCVPAAGGGMSCHPQNGESLLSKLI